MGKVVISAVLIVVFALVYSHWDFLQDQYGEHLQFLKKLDETRPRIKHLITPEELKSHDENAQEVWLSILGQVFDVTSGAKHYGKDGGYSFFSGKDATRAYVTGDFQSEGLVPDIDGLSFQEILGIKDWLKFYQDSAYPQVGYLEGYFYDNNGVATKNLENFLLSLELAERSKQEETDDWHEFPGCNSQSGQNMPTEVWCSKKSGGVDRDWVGKPRLYHKIGESSVRCACASDSQLKEHHSLFKEYPGCDPTAEKCVVKN